MRPLIATIHSSALSHNLLIARQLAPHSKIMAVVKANGYGHGLLNAASGLQGADGFAVLGLEEAMMLRLSGCDQTILLLQGVFADKQLQYVAEKNLSVVIHHAGQAEMLLAAKLERPIHVFLKMNSGMNRLGFRPEPFKSVLNQLLGHQNVASLVMMTHFATADDERGITAQKEVFDAATQGYDLPTSLANSAAVLEHPESHADWVRPGVMLYGASPVEGRSAASYGLKPVMRLTSQIIAVQTLQVGESAGYGNLFTAQKLTRLGVVACGYADGYPRHAVTGTPIAVAGKVTQTLGRVSMDMLFVDITHIPEAHIGTEVEIWGEQVSVDEVAAAAGTIGYELLCALAARVTLKVVD